MRRGTPSVGLAMIVKNEERGLARAVESVREFVDDILIVDTGSTDGTVDLAHSLGARVLHDEWTGDFSRHRNFSLQQVRGDYALIIDGDEVLHDAGDLKLATLAAWQHKVEVVVGWCVTVNDSGIKTSAMRQPRVMDRIKCRFVYPIHNQLKGWKKAQQSSAVFHAFYQEAQGKDRRRRNEERLLQMFEESEPGSDAWMHAAHYLTMLYWTEDEDAACIRFASHVIEHRPTHKGYVTAWVALIRAVARSGGERDAYRLCQKAIEAHPDYADLYWWSSNIGLYLMATVPTDASYPLADSFSHKFRHKLPEAGAMLGMRFQTESAA